MIRACIALASLIGASAFAPSGRMASSSALKMGFESEIGAQPPLGFFDPLGLLKNADQERFDRLRYVEVKHGRIAMLAVLGHLTTTAGVHLPGEIAYGTKFSDVANGLAGLFGPNAVPQQGLCQLIIAIGAADLAFTNYAQPEVEAFCAANAGSLDLDKKKAIELNNGRAAQMGILALMVHEKLNNDPYIINSLLGAPVPFNA
eukprot:CAMPEP_0182427624 /NCGR_PEP_ID=MMETSP1167-20130531/18921_1 /TAXON_ID=2988 /ORGANISM="Mallomonas Sp, Strain CCMP3275" /LENGTH=202 /DNA_ID=CAMNT_0024609989 /DNA_START=56 /DNA_END=664 /DNA_ORIENTATION=+